MKKLFIGQLSYSTTEGSLRAFFDDYPSVQSVKVITDPTTGRSRGFGFVEFGDASEAEEAIDALNGTSLDGREIVVNEARPQQPRSGGSDRGFRNNGGGFERKRQNRNW